MRAFRFLVVTALAVAGLSIVVAPPASAAVATVSGFQQCLNGGPPSTALTCTWANGAIQSNNSHYAEDESIPQRVQLALPADNLVHTLTFTYQDKKSNKHAYDSLATWNKTVTNADPCLGLSASICAGAPSTLQMTADPEPNVPPTGPGISPAPADHDLPDADRMWTMYGGVLTSDAVLGHDNPLGADDLVKVSVSFRNPTPGTARTAVLLFGGHLAVGGPNTAPRAWGQGLGASSVSGGPYAFKLDTIDGGSTGATANSIQAGAAAPLPAAAFTITKTARSSTAAAGTNVTYDVVVTNTGGQPGSATFTDNYPDNATAVTPLPAGCVDSTAGTDKRFTCTTGTINPGLTQTITYALTMPTSFTGTPSGCTNGGYQVVNTVTVTGGASDNETVCVTASPTFTIVKTARSSTAAAGGNVIYDVVVTNTGSAPGSTSFTDNYDDNASTVTLPGNCTDTTVGTDKKFTCTTGTINPGLTQTITYTMKMPASFTGAPGTTCALNPGSYAVINTVTVTSGASDSETVCVSAAPAFTITKEASSLTAAAGGTITYTVTVRNTGTAPGSTSFTDDYNDAATAVLPLASGCVDATVGTDKKFTCTTGTINPGLTQVFTYDIKMPTSFTGSPTCSNGRFAVPNTVTLSTGGTPATVTVCVDASPAFLIEKTPRSLTAAAGTNVTYDVVVTNNGAAPGSTSFTDNYDDAASTVTLPGNCTDTTVGTDKKFTCTTGTINPGLTQTITYTMKMPPSFTGTPTGCTNGGFPVVNSVTITGSSSDSATVCVTAAPAFAIDKTVAPTDGTPPVNAGDSITYTIKVTNTGTASGATSFTDTYDRPLTDVVLPTGCSTAGTNSFSCNTGVLAPLTGQQTFIITAKVPASFTGAPDCGAGSGFLVINNAVLANQGGQDGANVCVAAAPNFTINKTVAPTDGTPPVNAGDSITYTIKVTNTGTASGATSFTDDYDDDLTNIVLPAGCALGTGSAAGTFTCTTGTLAPINGMQTFTITANVQASFTGAPDCGQGTGFNVPNTATLANNGPQSSANVCVPAAPAFAITKTVANTDPNNAVLEPGESIKYTITVTNNGTAAGATSFTDDYDNNLTNIVLPSGCTLGTGSAAGTFTCNTTTLAALGGMQTFIVTANVPLTFTGPSNCPQGYQIANTATLVNVTAPAASANACVTAAPKMTLNKSASLDTNSAGEQIITYTLSYTNTGPAEANGVVITDPVPTGTAFVSCVGCTTTGTPVSSASWNVGSVAPLTGSGSVSFKVRVTTNQACTISNTASIKVGSGTPVPSNTVSTNVTPQPDPSGAKSNGSAVGVQVKTKGLLQLAVGLANAIVTGSGSNQVLLIGSTSSSQSGLGGPNSNESHLLTLNLPLILNAGVLQQTASSSVTAAPAETRQTSTSEVAGVCLVPVAGICTVQADVVRAVASTMANGSFSAVSSAGSTITNLRVAGVAVPVDLNQTTTIPLNPLLFGSNSYVAINERTSSNGLVNNKYSADMTVSMIHVKITNLALVGALDVVVAQAKAHSEFPKTLVCSGGTHGQLVSGDAYAARLYTGPLLADLLLGYTQISPLGGHETEHIAQVVIPKFGVIADAQVADTSSSGVITPTSSTASSFAEVAGDGTKPLCVISYVSDCVVKATAVRAQANALANSSGSVSNDSGTLLLGASVLGIPLAVNPAPNTTIALPGIGFIILNEQFCDGGGAANHTCSGSPHSGITVRAIRIVITVANNLLGLNPGVELVVSEAHADARYS